MLNHLIDSELEVTSYSLKDRLIGEIHGNETGPTVIFTAGIHGNEPSGVTALEMAFLELSPLSSKFKGNVYAIKGNLSALEKGVRFIHEDLNRIWSFEEIEYLNTYEQTSERKEQKEIYDVIHQIIKAEPGPFYFFDLHTTSCKTIPFLTVNDSMINREFVSKLPLPVVLGIEEYLEGPILSYINELGHVAFGFEGGQHNDEKSIINHYHFINLCLGLTGVSDFETIDYEKHYEKLKEQTKEKYQFYEIYDYQRIKAGDAFEMKAGFENFELVLQEETLATLNNKILKATHNSTLFMPLYQHQGDDGYFFIRKIPMFFFWLSKYVRNLKWILTLLPGVKKINSKLLLVNTKIARILPKQVFHLFGFRSKKHSGKYYMMKSRD